MKRLVLAIAIMIMICLTGCDPFAPSRWTRQSEIVMSPDGTRFAYSLPTRRWIEDIDFTPPAAREEIWIYDLEHRKGPRKLAAWSHDPDLQPRLLQWTTKGLYVEYQGPNESPARTYWEIVDAASGRRRRISRAEMQSDRLTGDQQVPVTEEYGEFILRDQSRRVVLFTVDDPQDPRAFDKERAANLRADGILGVESLSAAPSATGVTLHLETTAPRPATFDRRYTLRVNLTVLYDVDSITTSTRDIAVLDTTMVPQSRGGSIALYVPYKRFWSALRRERVKTWDGFDATVTTLLIPDSMAGDDQVPDDRGRSNWVNFPLH